MGMGMEHLNYASMDNDLSEDEEAGESSQSQSLQEHMLPESNDSFDLATWEIVEVEPDEDTENVEELKLAFALTIVTLEGFNVIDWERLEESFHECLDEFSYFKDQVFDAMASFVWNLYDEEDFENISFTDDIFNECERILQSVCLKGYFELDSSLIEVNKYEKVREQDVCNILMWCNTNTSPYKDELKEFSNFRSEVLLHPNLSPFHERDFGRYVKKARDAISKSDNLDQKGMVKKQLRMELNDCKCFCIVDALYMRSWKHMNIQKLDTLVSSRDVLEDLTSDIHNIFYELAATRIKRLHKCESLVTYPLSSNIYGSWDSEVQEVIEWADLKRRSEGRRFIGTDHLVFYLHEMLVSESANKSEQSKSLETYVKHKGKIGELIYNNPSIKRIFSPSRKNSKDLRSRDAEEIHKDTVYHLYRKAHEIATELGHQTIGLEHIYVAITNDDESSWKDSVDRVRMVKTKREGKNKEEYEAHTNLWKKVLEDSDGTRHIKGSVLAVVKKIQDKSNTPLQEAISDVLMFKVDERRPMSEGEMIDSLKKTIEIHRPRSQNIQENPNSVEPKNPSCSPLSCFGNWHSTDTGVRAH